MISSIIQVLFFKLNVSKKAPPPGIHEKTKDSNLSPDLNLFFYTIRGVLENKTKQNKCNFPSKYCFA